MSGEKTTQNFSESQSNQRKKKDRSCDAKIRGRPESNPLPMKTHKKYSAMCQRKKRPKIFRKPMKPTKKQMQKLWRRQKLARTRSVIYDGILIFMTVLYSTIILISREDIFFHQGTFLDTIFNISGCHGHTDTSETRKPLIRGHGLGLGVLFS